MSGGGPRSGRCVSPLVSAGCAVAARGWRDGRGGAGINREDQRPNLQTQPITGEGACDVTVERWKVFHCLRKGSIRVSGVGLLTVAALFWNLTNVPDLSASNAPE